MKKSISIITSILTLTIFSVGAFVVLARPATLAPPQTAASAAPESLSYDIAEVDYAWIDISAAADEQISPTEFEDNVGSAAIDIGFTFPFFDESYDTLAISDNGYLYFGGDEADGGDTPQAIPSAVDGIHNLIAPLGADLFRNPADTAVFIARQSEPEPRLVIQFDNAYWCCSLDRPVDFQVVLYPDGRILTQYQHLTGDEAPHVHVAIGLENGDGAEGVSLYTGFLDETDRLADESAILYEPIARADSD